MPARQNAPPGAEPLSRADVSNLVIDTPDQVNVFLMAGVLGTGGFVRPGGDPDLEALRSALSARLADDHGELRHLSMRPAGPGRRPVWGPSPPDLRQHVRLTEPVRGPTGLTALCARLMTVPMPRDRPLWELLVVPGVSAEGPGIVLRLHHAMADGAAGVDLVQHLFGAGRTPPPVSSPVRRHVPPVRRMPSARQLRSGLLRVSAMFRSTVPATVLLGPISPSRGVAFTGVDLEPLRTSVRAAGATVNDALLTAVTAAAEAALTDAGEEPPPTLPTSVPLALPDRGGSGNAVGVMLVRLPTGEHDPERRLADIAAATRAGKDEARAQGTFELTRSRWGSRAMVRLARRQRFIALFVTNVRGPAQQLSVAGAPLVEAWPVAQIQGNVRLGVAAMSYAGRLSCSVHVGGGALSAEVAAAALGAELERLSRSTGPVA